MGVKKDFKDFIVSLSQFCTVGEWIRASKDELLNQFFHSAFFIIDKENFYRKIETPSLIHNLFTYSKSLIDYYNNLNKKFDGLDSSDKLLFETIVEKLCKEILQNNEISSNFLLYEKLYAIFIENLIWKKQKSSFLTETRTSGIYIIYNKESLITYVGESKHIEKRIYQHYNSLLEGRHYNNGLQKACNFYGIDSFVFLVAQYGDVFKDFVFRRQTEINLINSWPGVIYNIKDVFR